MKCLRCGKEVSDDLKVCDNCGFDLESLKDYKTVYVEVDPEVDKKTKISMIAHFGYGYKNHTDVKWYAITQFMIWQAAYSEFWYSSVLWPDFNSKHLDSAILDYQKRNRRFGGV